MTAFARILHTIRIVAASLRPASFAGLGVVLALGPPALEAQSSRYRTVLDGVYSDMQAARGEAAYTDHCGVCHGDGLEGVSAPSLVGERFLQRWRELVLEPMFDFVRQRMPPPGNGDSQRLPDADYVDIVAYMLKANGYASGAGELTSEAVRTVMLVGKDGPQPVPDGALVLTVGCLSRASDGWWVLFDAAEPKRTRTEVSTPEELRAASEARLGNLTFRLADLAAVRDFSPEAHMGHKMQAKGYLVRQPNAERISLSSMEPLDAGCAP